MTYGSRYLVQAWNYSSLAGLTNGPRKRIFPRFRGLSSPSPSIDKGKDFVVTASPPFQSPLSDAAVSVSSMDAKSPLAQDPVIRQNI